MRLPVCAGQGDLPFPIERNAFLPSYANSASNSGWRLTNLSRLCAAPLGTLRPCSHSCKVRTDTPVARANSDCDKPAWLRAAKSCHCGPTNTSWVCTVPLAKVTVRRTLPSANGSNVVVRAALLLSLLILESAAPRAYQSSGWEDEETRDSFDRFVDNGQLPIR